MSVDYFMANGGNKVHWTDCSGVKRAAIRAGSLQKRSVSKNAADLCAFCIHSAPDKKPAAKRDDDVIDLCTDAPLDDRKSHQARFLAKFHKRQREPTDEGTSDGSHVVVRYFNANGKFGARVQFLDGTIAGAESTTLDDLNLRVGEMVKSAYE